MDSICFLYLYYNLSNNVPNFHKMLPVFYMTILTINVILSHRQYLIVIRFIIRKSKSYSVYRIYILDNIF